MSRTERRLILVALSLGLVTALSCGPTVPPPEKRTFHDAEGRFTYVVPPGWIVWLGEARSPQGSLFSVEPVSLEDSMDEFVRGLPGTMVTLLREQTERFFAVVGGGAQTRTTLGGVPAVRVVFPVRVRAGDPESEVTYWVARHGNWVYALRISYPAGLKAQDEPAVNELIASWKFAPLPTPDPNAPPSKLVPLAPDEAMTPPR